MAKMAWSAVTYVAWDLMKVQVTIEHTNDNVVELKTELDRIEQQLHVLEEKLEASSAGDAVKHPVPPSSTS